MERGKYVYGMNRLNRYNNLSCEVPDKSIQPGQQTAMRLLAADARRFMYKKIKEKYNTVITAIVGGYDIERR